MPCYRPFLAHRSTTPGKSGKMPLTFKASEAYTDLPVVVPCGKCIGCKTDKANEWAARCVHESKMHDENSFITLTYNQDHLPKDGSLDKKHFQDFMMRLRNSLYPKQIRYFACGEYGENFSRPHYHCLLFGHVFPDCVLHNRGRKPDQHQYKSEILSNLWGKGFVTVGKVDVASCKYVAAYTAKKITGELAPDHYKGKLPEFALMSRKPGIGATWFEKYTSDVYPKDFFTIKGIKYRPSRYYDTLLEKKRPKTFNKVKNKRFQEAQEDPGGVRRYYVAHVKETIKKKTERRRFEK